MVMNIDIITKYFPDLTSSQIDKLSELYKLYKTWNEKINVISRKDIDNIYLHHVLHSISLLRFYSFYPEIKFLDIGTGGGFPGIPLAIILEDCDFTLIDGKAKKIKVVSEIAEELSLKNVKALHKRAEEFKEKFDFITIRAVASLDKLRLWSMPLLKNNSKNPMPPGLFSYKGGNIKDELKLLERSDYYESNHIYDQVEEEYFKEKYIIYLQK